MRAKSIPFVIPALFASLASGQPQPEPSPERTFPITHAETAQNLQEMATDLRKLTGYSTAKGMAEPEVTLDDARKTVTLRGTAGQIALAEWVVSALDKPGQDTGHEYRLPESEPARPASLPGGRDDVVRVFYLTHAETPGEIRDIAIVVRSVSAIFRAFTYSASRAIVMRGTADQMAVAEWLFNDLYKQSQNPGTHEYRPPAAADDVVRVFYLTHAGTAERLQEIATQVRSTTEVRRLFIYNASRAIALRGTAGQMAIADRLIQERDR